MRLLILLCVLATFMVTYYSLNAVDKKGFDQKMIHHPIYGDYPAEIPFEQGMTLMPGQSAVGTIIVEIPN